MRASARPGAAARAVRERAPGAGRTGTGRSAGQTGRPGRPEHAPRRRGRVPRGRVRARPGAPLRRPNEERSRADRSGAGAPRGAFPSRARPRRGATWPAGAHIKWADAATRTSARSRRPTTGSAVGVRRGRMRAPTWTRDDGARDDGRTPTPPRDGDEAGRPAPPPAAPPPPPPRRPPPRPSPPCRRAIPCPRRSPPRSGAPPTSPPPGTGASGRAGGVGLWRLRAGALPRCVAGHQAGGRRGPRRGRRAGAGRVGRLPVRPVALGGGPPRGLRAVERLGRAPSGSDGLPAGAAQAEEGGRAVERAAAELTRSRCPRRGPDRGRGGPGRCGGPQRGHRHVVERRRVQGPAEPVGAPRPPVVPAGRPLRAGG